VTRNAKYNSLQERLEKNSREQNSEHLSPCRIWLGYCQQGMTRGVGYGRINLTQKRPGDTKPKSRKFPVHRVAKTLSEILTINPSFNFYEPGDKKIFFDLLQAYSLSRLTIDHLCKNALCINPNHLEWVTLNANQRRKYWLASKRRKRIKRRKQNK